MDWTNKIPEEPGYYFVREYGDEEMVEVVMTVCGPRYLDFPTLEMRDCYDFSDPEWLGPIRSEDIINLWKSFNDDKKAKLKRVIRKERKNDQKL